MNYIRNPFSLKEIPIDGPFCDRKNEMKELSSHARNYANVVLYFPRRYGKTSLVKRIQKAVYENGAITVLLMLSGPARLPCLPLLFVTDGDGSRGG